jgi:hypothetical protein
LSSTPYGWLDRAALERRVSERIQALGQSGAPQGALRRSDLELLGERHWPQRHHTLLPAVDPGADVAFLTVANDRFYRGLEALLLSLCAVYPQLSSPVVVIHDGTLGPFLQRRLSGIHPLLRFAQPEPAWADTLPRDSRNRRRIGALGYLNSEALALRGYRRVIVLDADLLITGSLDPLWAEGETFRAVPDCGDRPWAAVSPHTGRPVLNSGVLSLPGAALTSPMQQRMEHLIRNAADPVCPLLDRFADQKVWNQLLADQPVELLPLNFNCNVKYLVQYLGGCSEGLSVLHFAGPKPWLTWPWLEPDPADDRPGAVQDHLLWNRCYRGQLMAWRLDLHQQAIRNQMPLSAGPAQLALDPRQFTSQSDSSRHLLLIDPELLGSSWPDHCRWPDGWLPALAAAAPLQIWAPLLWEPALAALPLPASVGWRWLLIEPPFSADLKDGDDLPATTGTWAAGFEPWSDPLLPAVERAVRRQLQKAGALPRAGLAGAKA